MSGIFSPITNDHREMHIEMNTTVGIGSSDVYLTVPFASFAKLDRVIIQSQNDSGSSLYNSNLTLTIMSDGGQYRVSGAAPLGVTATPQNGNITTFNLQKTYYEDAYKMDFVYLRLTGITTLPSNIYFTVAVEGFKQQPYLNADWENNHITREGIHNAQPSFKVYRFDSVTSTYEDLTQKMRSNGNPYSLSIVDQTLSYPVLINNSDYLYIGSAKPFSKLVFYIPTPYRLAGGTAITKEFLTTTWQTIPVVYDNTSDGRNGQLDSNGFNFSGTMSIGGMVGWGKSYLNNDPEQLLEIGISTGFLPQRVFHPKQRYWIRFKVPSLSSPLNMTAIHIIE